MKIFISAGDPSGDLHGSNLVKELKKLSPDIEITGLGGKRMELAGVKLLHNLVDFSTIGILEPVRNYFKLREIFNKTKSWIEREKPDGVVLIDYYGFNIHLARLVKRLTKKPVIYYISPQIWATRPKRIKKIKEFVDKMLVIFPFEQEIYKKEGVKYEFVGHPFLDIIPNHLTIQPSNHLTIGIMPGSRTHQIKYHLPTILEVISEIIKEIPNIQFVLVKPLNISEEYLIKYFKFFEGKIKIISDDNYETRGKFNFCITCSGSATVENAILGIPMIILYRTSWLTYFLAKIMINIQYIGMVNLLAGEMVCPEYIQSNATPENIFSQAIDWIKNPEKLVAIKEKLAGVRQKLGNNGASSRSAKIILDIINK